MYQLIAMCISHKTATLIIALSCIRCLTLLCTAPDCIPELIHQCTVQIEQYRIRCRNQPASGWLRTVGYASSSGKTPASGLLSPRQDRARSRKRPVGMADLMPSWRQQTFPEAGTETADDNCFVWTEQVGSWTDWQTG